MKNLQKIKVTMLNGRAFNYVVTQEENNGIMKMRTARGKKEFFVKEFLDSYSSILSNQRRTKIKKLFIQLVGVLKEHDLIESNYKIISNDIEYYSYIVNYANLHSSYTKNLEKIINDINNRTYDIEYKKLVSVVYSPNDNCERMFFTNENADFIDYSMNVNESENITNTELLSHNTSIDENNTINMTENLNLTLENDNNNTKERK